MSACAPTGSGQRRADLSASISVFLIALPLSLGIALATGAPLQAGLVAAAVGGIVVGRLGGAPLQVSGPAAGLTVITADLIQTYGWRVTCAITVLAGLTQLALSAVRVARTALVVSPAIVHGMLGGIGVTIAVSQLHIVLGGNPDTSVAANVAELPAQLANVHPSALVVGGLTIAVLLAWPRLPRPTGERVRRAVPAALAAVTLATLVATLAGFRMERVDLPSWSSHALPQLPEGPALGILAGVLTVTLVASVESLLSAVAVDKLATKRQQRGGPPRPRLDLDRELRGQGAANVVSGSLGGLPVTGVAVRSTANVAAGAVTRNATIWHGCWVVLAAGALVGLLELIPLAALAALVMVVGIQMVNITHIRNITQHREIVVYAVTMAGVVMFGVLEGVGVGIAAAIAVALHRLTHTRIDTVERPDGGWLVRVDGQLTFLAVPRLTRALHAVPDGTVVTVELDGSFMDHAAYETLHDWRASHATLGGRVEITGRSGEPVAEVSAAPAFRRPRLPWHNYQRAGAVPAHTPATEAVTPVPGPAAPESAPAGDRSTTPPRDLLLSGVRNFQRTMAPRVRADLARLARDGQQPGQLFLACADSRLVTSMITSSGPGDLFTVRNVGNLVPDPADSTPDCSVAAAIEYAVTVLRVRTITVCGHSGCGAMQALHRTRQAGDARSGAGGSDDPLHRWLRHARASLERLERARPAAGGSHAVPDAATLLPGLAGEPEPDGAEALCLANVVQQLEHLAGHACVADRVRAGELELRGMYFDVGRAQGYVLTGAEAGQPVFRPVEPDVLTG